MVTAAVFSISACGGGGDTGGGGGNSASAGSSASTGSTGSSGSSGSSGNGGGSASSSSSSSGSGSGGGPASIQTAPGTATRPILSAAEAANFTIAKVLAHSGPYASPVDDPWTPTPIDVAAVKPSFVVGPKVGVGGTTHDTLQKAVNAAFALGGVARVYIEVLAGTYTGAVYVPTGSPPLTVYGAGASPNDVNIGLSLDAIILPADYAALVNPSNQYAPGDPAWAMFDSCAGAPAAKKIDTPCAAVFWVESDGFQLKNLTVTNTLLDTVDSGTHQAVALRTDGDKAQLEGVRLIGRQDTFWVNAGDPPNSPYQTDHIARAYIKDSYIEGDTDFVFGRANAVFDHCDFKVVSTRKPTDGLVFAPDTVPASPVGFLVIDSHLSADSGYAGAAKASLGRSWDQGAGGTGYLPGTSPNGQLVIRDSSIDASYEVVAPWAAAATTKRPYAGNIGAARDLNDPSFNRLWEYDNIGQGTGAP